MPGRIPHLSMESLKQYLLPHTKFLRWAETASPLCSNDYYLCKLLRKDLWMKAISSSRSRKYQYRLEALGSHLAMIFYLKTWLGTWSLSYNLLDASLVVNIAFVAVLVAGSNCNSVYVVFLRLGTCLQLCAWNSIVYQISNITYFDNFMDISKF